MEGRWQGFSGQAARREGRDIGPPSPRGLLRAADPRRHAWLRRGWHGKAFPTSRLALVAQYDHVRLEGPLDGSFVSNSERRTTFGLNYRPSHYWVLKLDYEDSEATAAALQKGDSRGYLASVGFQF